MNKEERDIIIATTLIYCFNLRSVCVSCGHEDTIVEAMRAAGINACQVDPLVFGSEISTAAGMGWDFDLLLMTGTDDQLKPLLDADVLINIKQVTNKVMIMIDHISSDDFLMELLTAAFDAGFLYPDFNPLQNSGIHLLSLTGQSFLSIDETKKIIRQRNAFYIAKCLDIEIDGLDARKAELLRLPRIINPVSRDWRVSEFPKRRRQSVDAYFNHINKQCIRGIRSDNVAAENFNVVIFTVLTKQPDWMLFETVKSMRSQVYPYWLLVVFVSRKNTSLSIDKTIEELKIDRRIKLVLYEELDEVTDLMRKELNSLDMYTVVGCGDLLEAFALSELVISLSRHPYATCFETDVAVVSGVGIVEKLILGPTSEYSDWRKLDRSLFTLWRHIDQSSQYWRSRSRDMDRVHIPRVCYRMKTGSDLAQWQNGIDKFNEPAARKQNLKEFQTPFGNTRVIWNSVEQLVSIICVSFKADDAVVAAVRRLQRLASGYTAEFIVTAPCLALSRPDDIAFINCAADCGMRERLSAAVSSSKGAYIVFIDVAVRPMFPDWIAELLGPINDLDAGVVGGRVTERHSGQTLYGETFDINGKVISITDKFSRDFANRIVSDFIDLSFYKTRFAIPGNVFAVSRASLESVGSFNMPEVFPRIDIDLCLRIRAAAKQVFYNPFASFWSFGPALLSDWTDDEEWAGLWLRQNYPCGDPTSNPSLMFEAGHVVMRGRAC